MRSIDEIRADSIFTKTLFRRSGSPDTRVGAIRLADDVLDLLAALAEKDAEIERLQNEIDDTAEFHNQRQREAWQDHANQQRQMDDLRRKAGR